jgi:DNA-binding NtrC family response regulator/tetratricopeptide (TPR) repeat protein
MTDAAQRAGEALAKIASLTQGGLRRAGSDAELAQLYFSIDLYEDAVAILEETNARETPGGAPIETRLLEAWCRFHMGDLPRATAILDSLSAALETADPTLVGRAETLRSWVLLQRGLLGEALASARSAVARLRATNDHRGFGDSLLALGRVHWRLGSVEEALDEFRDALASFRRAENLSGIGRALHDMSLAEKSLGKLAAAEEGYREAIEIAEQLGQRRFLMTRRHSLAILLFHRGQRRASLRMGEAALDEAIAIGDGFVEACARITCARALMAGGEEPDRARALLERALAIAAQRGFRREEALACEFLGDLAREQSDWPSAETWWRRALAIGERVAPRGDVTGEPLRRLAEARLAAGDVPESLAFARRAYDVTRGCGDRREAFVVLRVLGTIADARGRARAAWGAYQASVRGLESLGARGELAGALLFLGEHLARSAEPGQADFARETLTRAVGLFEEADHSTQADAARALLAKVGGPLRGAGGASETDAVRAARRAGRAAHTARSFFVRGVRGRREILTRDPSFVALLDRISVVAKGGGALLLLGETGTGKELLARLAHDASGRRGRFVAANAAAFPEGLVESELFGHVRGAFTGAIEEKVGLIEAADGGTFFLDEVGDLPQAVQVKLLRVLDETVVKRVGAIEGRPVDVRFVAATNRDLGRMVREGTFRRDLFYRLSVHEVQIPPLRDRRGDVALLATHLLARLGARDGTEPPVLSTEALGALEAYAWPGNVRELENEMERAFARAGDAQEIRLGHLSPWVAAPADPSDEPRVLRGEIAAIERMRIREALTRSGGNTAQAAQFLGVTRQALRYKIQKYGLSIERPRSTGQTRH